MTKEKIVEYSTLVKDYFISLNMNEDLALGLNILANSAVIAIVAIILDIVFRKLIVQGFRAFADGTTTTFDDYLVQSNM